MEPAEDNVLFPLGLGVAVLVVVVAFLFFFCDTDQRKNRAGVQDALKQLLEGHLGGSVVEHLTLDFR